jgi:autotransporter-associated beta strand protein
MRDHATHGARVAAAAALLTLLTLLAPALAGGPDPQPPEKVREILVPFSDLNVILENQPRRVLLSRAEYDALVKKAKTASETHGPKAPGAWSAVLASAEYQVTTEAEQARFSGTLAIDVLEDGLHAVPLDLGGVGLVAAKLDDREAPIGRGPDGRLSLLVEGAGRHRLALEMIGPLETTSAQQVLNFRLPQGAAGRMTLTVPGDVELKSGAAVLSRRRDEAAGVTRFDLLPPAGQTTILLSLNSHLQRLQQVVAAREVLVDEVTEACERLHASLTLVVLHRAVDRFRFVVPPGFEITQITSPLLSRWDVVEEAGRKVANVRLREQTVEPVVLSIAAVRAPAVVRDWQFPHLEVLDVVSQVAILGLLVQEHWKAESLVPQGLLAIDASVLSRAVPATLLRPEPGSAAVRAVAAFYAPQAKYTLGANFKKPEAEMGVTSGVLLVLAEKGCEVRGGLTLVPETEKQFSFDLSVPAGWQVTSVTGPDGKPLAMETYAPVEGPGHVRVRLPQGIAPGRPCPVRFSAVSTPAGWLDDWKARKVEFPVFAVAGASSDEGAAAAVAQDDIEVRPDRLDHLVPLTEPEKAKYGLAGVATGLAYRYEKPGYAATLSVERTRPRLTARTFSFFQVKPEGLAAHYELIYQVDDARTRRLALLLPLSTPQSLRIYGLGDLPVKEYTPKPAGRWRQWNVLLGEGRRGELRLAVDFEVPLPKSRIPNPQSPIPSNVSGTLRVPLAGGTRSVPDTLQGGEGAPGAAPSTSALLLGYPLPLVRAEDVVYQTGNVAVEGSPELDIQIHTEARRADVGQLAAAEKPPGRRLLGNFAFIGPPPDVDIDVLRHPAYDLAPAIIQRAELITNLSADGTSQTQADFRLRTKALFLEIRLPVGADLWSVELDGRPLKPQQEQGSLLVGLPAGPENSANVTRSLRLVYQLSPLPPGEAPKGYPGVRAGVRAAALGVLGRVRMPAPRLAFRAARDAEAVDLPLVDLVWKLRVPSGYEVVETGGTLVTGDVVRPLPAPAVVAAAAFILGGGIQPHYGLGCAAEKSAGKAKPKAAAPYYQHDDVGYFPPAESAPRPDPKAVEIADLRDESKSMAKADAPAAPKADEKPADRPDAALDEAARVVTRGSKAERAVPSKSLLEKVYGHEEAGVIPAEEPPIVYPPGDVWKELTARRKEKYSAGELAKTPAPAAKPAEKALGGEETARPEGGDKDSGVTKVYPVADLVIPIKKLSGVRSLKIAVEEPPDGGQGTLTFQSLGEEPVLELTLAHRGRFEALGWALALALGLWGIAITGRPVRQKAALVLAAALAAAVLPLVWDNVAVAWQSNMVFYAASLLVPYYLLAGAVRWIAAWIGKLSPRQQSGGLPSGAATTATVLLAIAVAAASALAFAAQARGGGNDDPFGNSPGPAATAPLPSALTAPPLPTTADGLTKAPAQEHVVLEEDRTPVNVPDDAVLVPYDAKSQTGIREADRLLVPYSRYVELWNRAYPDKKIGDRPVEWPYALGGASYSCALEGDESLRITGQVVIDVFADGYASVPLGVRGGVLARADLDGKPARVSVAKGLPSPTGRGAGGEGLVGKTTDEPLLLLHVSGKGRHTLAVEVRLRLSRQGGWRLAQGILPAAPASGLAIRVPAAHTEVRLGQPHDRRTRETQAADETIRTALGPAGELALGWRPRIAEAQVDRGLTVESLGSFDLQEDGLRLAWRLSLGFRRAERDAFTLLVPPDYLVEKVSGKNVRGWEARTADGVQTVDVSLLKPAKDAEQMTVYLWRGWRAPEDQPAQVEAPVVTVRDAALASGQVTILRSPMLEVRTLGHAGLTRIDLVEGLPADPDRPATQQSVLVSRPVESYHFATMPATMPFRLQLSAAVAVTRATADVQTLLKAAEYQPTLETRVVYHVQDRPVYRLRLVLPPDLSREQIVLGCPHQWTITEEAKRRVLTVDLAEGQEGDLPLVLTGVLGSPQKDRQLAVPRVEVLDVQRQQGAVVVQADPAFDVAARDLARCEEEPLGQVFGWLRPEQRPAARLALRYLRPDYAGALRLVPRKPEVACDTISNVRVTDRAVETTIFLNYTIGRAGIRQLAFVLPAWMADARISTAMLRQKTVEKLPAQAPGLHPGGDDEPLVRFRLELQDDVMGSLFVSVQDDRMLSRAACAAPVPLVENVRNASDAFKVRVDHQYVTLEKAARDEVVEDLPLHGLEPLGRQQMGRQQKQWQFLSKMLPNGTYQAYLADQTVERPRLTFHTVEYKDVQTAGARVDLAQTALVLDANGAYRARVTLSLDNSSQQYLDIELPEGAALWTVHVAGEPAKPAAAGDCPDFRGPSRSDDAPARENGTVPLGGPRHVLVPILKTARGDPNYEVVLKYGGKLPPLGRLGRVQFPLLGTLKALPGGKEVGIERSVVEVYVPDTYQWFNFSGTMHLVEEADVRASLLLSEVKQGQRLLETARQAADPFAKARAMYNLKRQAGKMRAEEGEQQNYRGVAANPNLQQALAVNKETLQEAEKQLMDAEQDEKRQAGQKQTVVLDNRNAMTDLVAQNSGAIASGTQLDVGSGGTVQTNNGTLQLANGTLVLNGNNTYSGGTTVAAGGMLAIAQPPAPPPATANVNGGWIAANQLSTYNPPGQDGRSSGAAEAQTGRLMFGVGVTSESGLTGKIVLDEQNQGAVPTPGHLAKNSYTGTPGITASGAGSLEVSAGTLALAPNAPVPVAPQASSSFSVSGTVVSNGQPAAPQVVPEGGGKFAAAANPTYAGNTTINAPVEAEAQLYQQKLNAGFGGTPTPFSGMGIGGLGAGGGFGGRGDVAMFSAPTRRPLLEARGQEFNRIAGPAPAGSPATTPAQPQSAGEPQFQPPALAMAVGQPQSLTVAKPGYVPAAPAGLASLDFELPERGRLYRFMTPRGEAELAAQAVSTAWLARLGSLSAIGVLVLVVYGFARVARRTSFSGLRTRTAAVLLALLGLFSLLVGVLPLAGLACLVIGIVALVKLHRRRRQPASAA